VFGSGFSSIIYSPGLVVVAATIIGSLAESTVASERLTALADRLQWFGPTRVAGFLGLIAGIASSPASAFALLTPLLPAIGGSAQPRDRPAATLALALSAGHGLLWLSPVPIAAAAILHAQWGRVAVFGLPLALLTVAVGALFARWSFGSTDTSTKPIELANAEKRTGGSAIGLILATAVPLAMLMVQSAGDMPSEPLGGGPSRELVLGIGRPLLLLLAGVGVMILCQPRRSLRCLADSTWTARSLGTVAGLLLTMCAAGGWQRLCQQTGMAELLGERLLDWHLGHFGVVIPFLIAAVIKTLQGSSLVAAITTAGMVQPVLTPLGLADLNGTAMAALAVGAGAMTISHFNDEYFWLVADRAGLTPLRGLTRFSLGTLLQGLVAVAALLLLSLSI
jgi:GntP family gluconate:H+ symporter